MFQPFSARNGGYANAISCSFLHAVTSLFITLMDVSSYQRGQIRAGKGLLFRLLRQRSSLWWTNCSGMRTIYLINALLSSVLFSSPQPRSLAAQHWTFITDDVIISSFT